MFKTKLKTQNLQSKEYLMKCLMITTAKSTHFKNKILQVSSLNISICPLLTFKKYQFLMQLKKIMQITKMVNHQEKKDHQKDSISKTFLLFINKFTISSIKIINLSPKYQTPICTETTLLCQNLVEKENHNNFSKAHNFTEL